MTDFQQVVDNVRAIVHSTDATSADAVAEVAEQYLAACDEANRRLMQCSSLLRQGLRSEAIQQAETEPKLLDAVALLDLPEMEAWRQLLRDNGLELTEPLMVEVAAELNEAYAIEQPLGALLRRHRIQALARAQLGDRIETLRQMQRLDVDNPIWEEDLRAFEGARHHEIQRATEDAYAQDDVETLTALRSELKGSPWRDPPAADLVQLVKRRHASVVKKQARVEMAQLVTRLDTAHGEFDAEAGRVARERWKQCLKVAGLDDGDPLVERAGPALDWLDEQDEQDAEHRSFETAVAQLERALDEDSLRGPELERLGHAVFRHDRPVSEILERRYHQRLAALELSTSRRTRLMFAVIGASALVLLAALGWMIVRHLHNERVTAAVSTLQTLIDEGQLVQAAEFLDGLENDQPRVYAAPEVQAIAADVRDATEDERNRALAFRTAMDKAASGGPEAPDRVALKQARELAKGGEEQQEVAEFETEVQRVDIRKQRERDEAFRLALEPLLERHLEVKRLHEKDPAEAEEAVAALRRDLSGVLKEHPNTTPPARQLAVGLETWIAAREAEYDRWQRENEFLAKIDQAIGDRNSFAAMLKQYCEQFPDSPRVDDFGQFPAGLPILEATDNWSRFAARWNKYDLLNLPPAEAKRVQAEVTEQLSKLKNYPQTTMLQSVVPYLEAIQRRADSSGDSVLRPLHELLTNPSIADLHMVELANGDRYYLKKPVDLGQAKSLLYIVDFDLSTTKNPRIVNPGDERYNDKAPQSILAKWTQDELARVNQQGWEPTFGRIVAKIYGDQRLDPIVKVILLQSTIEAARQGSQVLSQELAHAWELLDGTQLDLTVKWIDPTNDDAERVRSLASDLLERLKELATIEQRISARVAKIQAAKLPVHAWVGWLDTSERGEWRLRSGSGKLIDGLLVAARVDEGGSIVYHKIGSSAAGKSVLDSVAVARFRQGQPVFLQSSE